MSTRDALLIPEASALPEALRAPIEGVTFAAYLFVEAARLDALPEPAVLAWLGVREGAFAAAQARWSERVADELARDEARFDEAYEELLCRALSLWARPVAPLDREVEAWISFQRHALANNDSAEMARRAGLTTGDELRLGRLWRDRLVDPAIAARAAAAWSGTPRPLPKIAPPPIVFPPVLGPS